MNIGQHKRTGADRTAPRKTGPPRHRRGRLSTWAHVGRAFRRILLAPKVEHGGK